jgi:hypothetical protein
VIGFPLSLDLLDGLNVDVVGSDVLLLAHGLVVDGLLLGLSYELGAVDSKAVNMIVCFLWDCKFLIVGFDVLWLADGLAITILLLGLAVWLNVVNFDLLVFAVRLTATELTLGLSHGFNVLGINVLGHTLALGRYNLTNIVLAKDTFFGLALVSMESSSFSTTLKCSKVRFSRGTPLLLISDCSKPLPLIGVLADWFVNEGDNALGLIGLPDRVNVVGLDVLELVACG